LTAPPSGAPPAPGSSRTRGKAADASEAPADVVGRLFAEKAKVVAEKAAELAAAGDVQSMRLVLDRIAPAPKERPVRFTLPPVNSAADLPGAVMALMQATARGELVPAEAMQLAGVLEQYRKQTETAEFEARLRALEEERNAGR